MCFAIFELMKFMCFGSTLSYPHKEILNPCPPRTKYDLLLSHPAASSTYPAHKAVRVPTPALQMRVVYLQPARVNPLCAGL